MNTIIRIAIGAAVAGALVVAFANRRASRNKDRFRGELARASAAAQAGGRFTLGELIADTPAGRALVS